MMVAYRYHDSDIALLDANAFMAQKVKISGGGKCNITNTSVTPSHFYGEQNFIASILKHFGRDDLLAFLKRHGVALVLRKNHCYFCQNSSMDIISIFQNLKNFYRGAKVLRVEKKEHFIIHTATKRFACKHLIVASGGLSYPRIGASDIALEIAKSFGHTIVTPKPALVGLTVQKEQFWFKALSGLSIEVAISVRGKRFEDALLFTHKGISGPVVLNTSLYWDKGEIEVDFLPKISLSNLEKMPKKKIPLPKRFLNAFLERYPLAMLKSYRFAPAGNFGYSKAEAMRGGICTDEIDSESMMSLREKNLYFVGECLDVTGELGGYNLQWAFSSAQRLCLRG